MPEITCSFMADSCSSTNQYILVQTRNINQSFQTISLAMKKYNPSAVMASLCAEVTAATGSFMSIFISHYRSVFHRGNEKSPRWWVSPSFGWWMETVNTDRKCGNWSKNCSLDIWRQRINWTNNSWQGQQEAAVSSQAGRWISGS